MSHDRLLHTLLNLTSRERILLAVLGLVCLPLGIAFGVMFPLSDTLARTEREAATAGALLAWVEDEVQRLPLEVRDAAPADAAAPIGLAGIERSLVAAGLRQRIVELANRRAGEIEIALDPTAFTTLASWLESVEQDGGYAIAALRLEAADREGEVTARLTLAPRR